MVKVETEPLHDKPPPRYTGVTVKVAVWTVEVALTAVNPAIVFIPVTAVPIEERLFAQL